MTAQAETRAGRSVVAWYANSYSPRIASIRLRCLAPMEALRQSGLQTEPFSARHADRYRTVVFSKTYGERALDTARSLKAAGVRVVLDLCDNHFFGENAHGSVRTRASRLERMVALADVVVASTEVLMQQLRERFPAASDKLVLIPDYLEAEGEGRLSLRDRFALWRLHGFLRRHSAALHLIWFGNHGAPPAPAGMADLLNVREAIEAHARSHPVTLTVMSNSHAKYRRLISGWSIPTTYVGWAIGRAEAVLKRHDVAVLPITPNPFTLAKTINRPATAMLAGLGVIADAIPSYEELRPFIELDRWEAGLANYSALKPSLDPSVGAGSTYLESTYGPAVVTRQWERVL